MNETQSFIFLVYDDVFIRSQNGDFIISSAIMRSHKFGFVVVVTFWMSGSHLYRLEWELFWPQTVTGIVYRRFGNLLQLLGDFRVNGVKGSGIHAALFSRS